MKNKTFYQLNIKKSVCKVNENKQIKLIIANIQPRG